EDMAKQWNISRDSQDEWAVSSHKKLAAAYERGFFSDLIAPFLGVERDNILRPDTSLEKLATLKPAFDKTSGRVTLTAANPTAQPTDPPPHLSRWPRASQRCCTPRRIGLPPPEPSRWPTFAPRTWRRRTSSMARAC